jgi:integrase
MATIRIIKGRIYYHFRYQGMKCTERSGLEASPENVQRAQKFVKLIDAEIENGIFHYERHFPHGAKIQHFAPQRATALQPFFAD